MSPLKKYRFDPAEQPGPAGIPTVAGIGAAAAPIVGAIPAASSGPSSGGLTIQEVAEVVGTALAGPHDGIAATYVAADRTVTLENTDKGSTAVAAHVAAADPHGDRAFTTSAIATHSASADPHGDRAYAAAQAALRVAKAGDTMTGLLTLASASSVDSVLPNFVLMRPSNENAQTSNFGVRTWHELGGIGATQVWELIAYDPSLTAHPKPQIHLSALGGVYIRNTSFADSLYVKTELKLPHTTLPANEFDGGVGREVRVDDNYLYVRTATAWKTLALQAFKSAGSGGGGGGGGSAGAFASATLSSAASTNSTTFTDLMSATIVTLAGSRVVVRFTGFLMRISTGNALLRLVVDATEFAFCNTSMNGNYSVSVTLAGASAALAAGFHTVKLQWATVTGGSVLADPDGYGTCFLTAEERAA